MCETSIQMLMLDEIRLRLHVHHEPFCFFSGALLGLDADRTEMLDWMQVLRQCGERRRSLLFK